MALTVKICGLSTPEALDVALDAGVDMVGFVFFPPSPRNLSYKTAAALESRVRGRAKKVALSVDADDTLLSYVVDALGPDILQLHGNELPLRVAAIKARFKLPVMKAIPVNPKATSQQSPAMPRWPTGCCLTRGRRARRRARAASAKCSIGAFWKASSPACRICCRAGSMPIMSAKPCASPARPASMYLRAWNALLAVRTPLRSAPSCVPRGRRKPSASIRWREEDCHDRAAAQFLPHRAGRVRSFRHLWWVPFWLLRR